MYLFCVFLAHCHRSGHGPRPFATTSVSSLKSGLAPQLGETVEWRFGDLSKTTGLTVFDLQIDPVPFGLLLTGLGPEIHAAGKILGPQFRYGKIVVIARDMKGCEANAQDTASLALQNGQARGENEVVLAAHPCDTFSQPAPPFDHRQEFYWWLGDAAEVRAYSLLGKIVQDIDWKGANSLVDAWVSTFHQRIASSGKVAVTLTHESLANALPSARCGAFVTRDQCRENVSHCAWNIDRCITRDSREL